MAGPMNPYDAPEPPRQGMSGTTKVLLGLGIGCGVLVLLCCGGGIVGTMMLGKYAQNSVSKEPAKVVDATKEIIDIEVPESLKPVAVVDFRVPFSGQPMILGVVYESDSKQDHLILGQFGPLFQGTDLETGLKDAMNQSGENRQSEDLDIEESEQYETKINDQDADFRIARGKGRKSKKEFWEVVGPFHGHGGQAVLVMRLGAEEFTKEQVLDVIKSMED